MKKLLFLVILTLCIGFSLSLTLGGDKPQLDDFKLVTYDINNNGIEISSYSTVDKNGMLKVCLKRYTDTAFYNYQLSKDEIEKINKLTSNKLQNFVIKKQLDKNYGYAGSRNYLNFKVKNRDERLCFIQPFMNPEFNEVINLLTDKIYKQDETALTSNFKIDFRKIKGEILKQNEIDNYLPQKQLPPPPMRKIK
ncbi:hypothetical protein [Chryseobacterium sp. Mn2064]|uniref:hypothetical protein n=1 Tax=Chryseobacterium sp. Mn2064 TaxID=3395263 RepID=UPI003BD9879F